MKANIKLIEKFLRGTIRPEEQRELEQLRQNPDFEAELQGYQRAHRAIRQQGEEELKKRLQQREAQRRIRPTNTGKIRRLARGILGFAAALLLCLSAYLLWPSNGDQADYLSTYFTPALNISAPNQRGPAERQSTSAIDQAFVAYDQQEYAAAVQDFSRVQEEELLETAHFYQANALLALGNSATAIPLLESVLSNETYRYQSRWYLALAYLDTQQIDEAKPLLQELAKEEGAFRQKALELLERTR